MSNPTEIKQESQSQEKRFCRFHNKCKKGNDDEHVKSFVCVYQKPCKHGDKCNKISDSEHSKYFSHDTIKEVKSPVKNLKATMTKQTAPKAKVPVPKAKTNQTTPKAKVPAPKAKTNQTAPKSTPAPKKQRVKYDESNSDAVHITYSLNASEGETSVINVEGEYNTRVPKGRDAPKIRALLVRNLTKRFCGGGNFAKVDVNVDIEWESETIDVSDLHSEIQALPLPEVTPTTSTQ